MKMMERMSIILVLLWCNDCQISSLASEFDFAPCYEYPDAGFEISIINLPEKKIASQIEFSNDVNSINFSLIKFDAWERRFLPSALPVTNSTLLKQFRIILSALHIINEDISCDQLNKIVYLRIESLPFDYYYNNLQQTRKKFPVTNQSLCESDLERLKIRNQYKKKKTVLRNESFCEFKKLKFLDISANTIWEIEDDAFNCLEYLIEINLRQNKLSSLPQQVFSHNQRLQTVILSQNRLKSTVLSSLQSLINVSYLDLSYNEMETLPEVIPLKRLKRLDLRRNKLKEINRKVFSELVELEDVDLSNNELTKFHPETYRNNPEVKRLRLGENSLKSIPKIDNLSKLEVLDLSRNNIRGWINLADLFENHINLTDLRLNNNEIEGIIESSAFRTKYHNPNSENLVINLSSNRIQSLLNVTLPDHVTTFDVSRNRIQTACISNLGIINNNSRLALELYKNPLQCNCVNRQLKLPNYRTKITDFYDLECDLLPTPLNPIKEKRVRLVELEDEDGSVCRIEFNRSEQCVCFGIDDCSASNPLNGHCYALTDMLRSKVTHVCEHLTEIPSRGFYTDFKLHSRHHMYFNRNNIETLKLVHFDNNKLSEQCVSFHLEKSNVRVIENDAFNRVRNLQILSLRDNRIRVLPNNLFRMLTKLKELYLSNNRLITLTGQTINNVIKLELHNNSLTHLSITNNNKLLLSSHNLTNLSLHDNPWSCKCEFIQLFHNYLGNNADIIQRVKDIKCIDEQHSKYNVLQFDLSKCKPFLHLTAITTSTTFAVVIITITALIFIYRREMRVLVYSRYHIRIFGPEVDDDVSSKQYDAFMAYNSKDEDFLFNHLMPGLEAIPNPYRLCIHERDFLAGAFIQDSIIQAVQLSSRTIVLLSENFVESGWCRMEFKTAHAQMLQDRCPRVLLIVLGEIPRTLDPEMELYLRTNTYLRWGERLFWEKLYYAMPDQRVMTPPTDIMPMYQL